MVLETFIAGLAINTGETRLKAVTHEGVCSQLELALHGAGPNDPAEALGRVLNPATRLLMLLGAGDGAQSMLERAAVALETDSAASSRGLLQQVTINRVRLARHLGRDEVFWEARERLERIEDEVRDDPGADARVLRAIRDVLVLETYRVLWADGRYDACRELVVAEDGTDEALRAELLLRADLELEDWGALMARASECPDPFVARFLVGQALIRSGHVEEGQAALPPVMAPSCHLRVALDLAGKAGCLPLATGAARDALRRARDTDDNAGEVLALTCERTLALSPDVDRELFAAWLLSHNQEVRMVSAVAVDSSPGSVIPTQARVLLGRQADFAGRLRPPDPGRVEGTPAPSEEMARNTRLLEQDMNVVVADVAALLGTCEAGLARFEGR